MKLLILFFLVTNAYSFNQADELLQIAEHHHQVMNDLTSADKNLRLDRLDLQVGISGSGDLGVLTFGASSAVELIWMRDKQEDSDDIDTEREIIIDPTEESDILSQKMTKEIGQFVNLKILKRKQRKRIVRSLRRDAQKINALVKDLVQMPSFYGWYIDGFFKNYHFSASGDLLGIINLGYDKRIRFRFKVQRYPYTNIPSDSLSKKQEKLKRLMKSFSLIAQRQDKNDIFQLKRVWTINSLEKDLDLIIANIGKAKGVQIEFKKAEDYFQAEGLRFKWRKVELVNTKIINTFNNFDTNRTLKDLYLKQVRIKYTTDKGLDFQIASINKSSTIEFHYKR